MTFNPAIQYFNQTVVHRIQNPESREIPQLNENIAEYVRPDRELYTEAQEEVSAFDEAFELRHQAEDENKKK